MIEIDYKKFRNLRDNLAICASHLGHQDYINCAFKLGSVITTLNSIINDSEEIDDRTNAETSPRTHPLYQNLPNPSDAQD